MPKIAKKENTVSDLTQDVKAVSKIERIKRSAIEVIAQRGIANASVADIANHAEVSVGYLYRHYDGKNELINDITFDMYQKVLSATSKILSTSTTIDQVCEGVINYHYDTYLQDPDKIKFLLMLINDFSFDPQKQQKDYMMDICTTFYEESLSKIGIRKDLRIEEAYIALVVIPLQSFALKIRGLSLCSNRKEYDKSNIIKLSLKIIKE